MSASRSIGDGAARLPPTAPPVAALGPQLHGSGPRQMPAPSAFGYDGAGDILHGSGT